jgi:hypothetical protein
MTLQAQDAQELEELRSRWKLALQDGYQSKLQPVFQDRNRYYYIWRQLSKQIKPLETTIEELCIDDSLTPVRVTRSFIIHPNRGIASSTQLKPVNPDTFNLTPMEVMKLVNRLVREVKSTS